MLSNPGPQHYIVMIIGLILLCNFVAYETSGQVFSPNVQVDDGVPYIQYCPSIAIGPNGELYVLFNDMRKNGDMYFSKSLDKGKTWSRPNIRVSDVCIWEWMVPSCIDVDGEGILYACWGGDNRRDGDDDCDIYSTVSADGGETWSPNVRVNDDSEDGKNGPSMVLSPDHSLCVVWKDYRPYNDTDIYFARSADGGETWTDPSIRINDVWWDSQLIPKIALGEDQVIYATWYDARNRTQEDATDIYFARTVPVLAYGAAVLDTVSGGGNLEVTLTLINTTGYEHTADIWTGMALLKGGMYYSVDPAFGPQTFTLPPCDTLSVYVSHEITEDFPLAEYEYWVKVDDDRPYYEPPYRFETDPDRYYLFKDSFTFTVVGGRERAGVGLKGR